MAPPLVPTVAPSPAPSAPPAQAVPGTQLAPPAPAVPGANEPSQQNTAAMSASRRQAEADPLLFVVDGLSAEQWQSLPLQVYVSSGNDFGLINGRAVPVPGAEPASILTEFGCTHVLVKSFTRPQRNVQAVVFSFSNPVEAYGAYSCLRRGSTTVVARGDASSEDDNSVSFWKGTRFVYIKGSVDDDELSKNVVGQLADQLAAAIPSDGQAPALINRMSYLDRIAGSEKLFLGPQAARRFGNVPYIQDLSIEKSRGAAFADFQFRAPQPERMRALVVDYLLPSTAQQAFDDYRRDMGDPNKATIYNGYDIMAKHGNGYLMCSLRGSRIIVVSGARHKQSAPMLVRQLSF